VNKRSRMISSDHLSPKMSNDVATGQLVRRGLLVRLAIRQYNYYLL
jgi:hypothetical protein